MYVAHFVLLIDYKEVSKLVPPGVDFHKVLIVRQTNNWYVAHIVLSLDYQANAKIHPKGSIFIKC